jgi:flagellar biosynthesis protein FlhF
MEGNSVKLKTYHAYTMAEALAAVKRDLGADAVILHTRSFKRGGILGMFRRNVVEVTATPAASPAPVRNATAPAPKVKLKGVQAQHAYSGAAATSGKPKPNANSRSTGVRDQTLETGEIPDAARARSHIASSDPQIPSTASERDRLRTQRLAMALEEAHNRKPNAAHSKSVTETKSAAPAHRHVLSAAPPPASGRTARRFILTSPEQAKKTIVAPDAKGKREKDQSLPQSAIVAPPATATEMQDELVAIRNMVGQVLQRQVTSSAAPVPAMPRQLFDLYLKMVAQDISNELADQIVNEVRSAHVEEELEDEQTVRRAVRNRLAQFIPVAPDSLPYVPSDGRPLIIAMVGPTGVGKTTTLAKLAATFKLNHGKSVGLVTADTYRIAAVDQLRTYADILGLPMHVALTPTEMKRSVQTMSDREVILIDTAGRSQRDANRISELKRYIAAANPHEVHLVLSGTAGEKVLLQEAQVFSEVGVHKIVLTKLDEAVTFGVLVNAIRQIGKQLSYVTTGQEVPDHIEVGSAERLADLVLGAESCGVNLQSNSREAGPGTHDIQTMHSTVHNSRSVITA